MTYSTVRAPGVQHKGYTYIPCEVITTLSLANMHPHTDTIKRNGRGDGGMFLLGMRILRTFSQRSHTAVVTVVITLYLPFLVLIYLITECLVTYLQYLTTRRLYVLTTCLFIDSFIRYVQTPPGSHIGIFVIIYLSQDYLTPEFKTFVVVILGGPHLNLMRLWLQTAWKLSVS